MQKKRFIENVLFANLNELFLEKDAFNKYINDKFVYFSLVYDDEIEDINGIGYFIRESSKYNVVMEIFKEIIKDNYDCCYNAPIDFKSLEVKEKIDELENRIIKEFQLDFGKNVDIEMLTKNHELISLWKNIGTGKVCFQELEDYKLWEDMYNRTHVDLGEDDFLDSI